MAFVERIKTCENREQICRELVAELRWFGFDFVTVFGVPGPGQELPNTIGLNTRPDDYIEHYHRNDYIFKDPVVTELRRTLAPFSWSDLQTRRLSKVERSILEEAREYGADDGFLIPILTPTGEFAVVSPCGHQPDLSPRARTAVEMIGIYAQQALQRATQINRRNEKLTPREREVLRWVAAGKTDDEIGEILKISHATVTVHVESCKRKLQASRRTYAVIQALRAGEITL